MDFAYSAKTKDYIARIEAFLDRYLYPQEQTLGEQVGAGGDRWQVPPLLEELKSLARGEGL